MSCNDASPARRCTIKRSRIRNLRDAAISTICYNDAKMWLAIASYSGRVGPASSRTARSARERNHPSMYSAITGWGMAVPARILTNADLERIVDTSDEWIVSRTGIRERHIAGPDESASTLAISASQQALERAGLLPTDLDMIILGTVTG